MTIATNSRWLEVLTGRWIVILGPGPDSPWWKYEDDEKGAVHYCCLPDFTIWGRFIPEHKAQR